MKQRRSRTVDNCWKKVIFSDESQIVLGANNRIYIWRKDDEKYNPPLICSRSARKISLMIWGCICYDGVGTLTAVEGNIRDLNQPGLVCGRRREKTSEVWVENVVQSGKNKCLSKLPSRLVAEVGRLH